MQIRVEDSLHEPKWFSLLLGIVFTSFLFCALPLLLLTLPHSRAMTSFLGLIGLANFGGMMYCYLSATSDWWRALQLLSIAIALGAAIHFGAVLF